MAGWLALAILFAGQYLVGSKRRSGYPLMILGNLFWVAEAVRLGSHSLLTSSLAFTWLAFYNWHRWNQADGHENAGP